MTARAVIAMRGACLRAERAFPFDRENSRFGQGNADGAFSKFAVTRRRASVEAMSGLAATPAICRLKPCERGTSCESSLATDCSAFDIVDASVSTRLAQRTRQRALVKTGDQAKSCGTASAAETELSSSRRPRERTPKSDRHAFRQDARTASGQTL